VTISLPKSVWGPATVLTVLLVLTVAIGGMVQVIRGEMTFDGWIDLMTSPSLGILIGGLAVGRGIAWGGPGTGMKEPTPAEPDAGKMH